MRFEGGITNSEKYAGIASMNFHIYRKYWYHKFGATQYVNAMRKPSKPEAKLTKMLNLPKLMTTVNMFSFVTTYF